MKNKVLNSLKRIWKFKEDNKKILSLIITVVVASMIIFR